MSFVAGLGGQAAGRQALAPWLFPIAVFASAALVFLLEPLVGKLLLPLLGGSPAIWNTSLAFFQAALLAGYAYAHLLQQIGPVRRQMELHLGVVITAALVLPLHISRALGPPWTHAPAAWCALVLALSVGPPFAALSATAPLLQAWFSRLHADRSGRADPYRLYAASNLGSLIALAAYPVAVEPLLGLSAQARLWSLAYGVFVALLFGLCASVRNASVQAPSATAKTAAAPIARWERLRWVLLAAAPSSLLLGVTSHITADVASAPFLWVVPLELYLLTFVVAFRGPARPPAAWLLATQLVSTPLALLLVTHPQESWPEQLVAHLAAFTVTALVCHQTLASRRPDPSRLTEFYLCISLGGVVGGAFNAFVAPALFPEVWEYPAVLVLACLARPAVQSRGETGRTGWLVAGLVWTIPLLIPGLILPDVVRTVLLITPALVAVMLRDQTLAVVVLYAAMALAGEIQGVGRYREHHRSFFGVVHITEIETMGLGKMRLMVHGTTLHGAQYQDLNRRCRATTYYAPATVIGQVFRTEAARKSALRIGAVGLGAGTVASFVRPSDRMRIFEIDPMVAGIAFDPHHFSFVRGCARGPVDLVLGDARLSLARERAGAYDLLLIDAFSSDSVPTHLLTVEAIRDDLRLLAPDGVLLLHLSNRNLELVSPASAAAKAAGGYPLQGEHWVTPSTSVYVESAGIVLLVARDPVILKRYRSAEWTPPAVQARAWTDDYTNVWGAMIARLRDAT